MVHNSTEKSEAKLMRWRPRGHRHRRATASARRAIASPSTVRCEAKAAQRPILDGHTVNRTEAAAVTTSRRRRSRLSVARRCLRRRAAASVAWHAAAAIVRAEDSGVPTGSSSALLSWDGRYKQGRLQLVVRKYSFFVFFSSLLRTFCWSPLAKTF